VTVEPVDAETMNNFLSELHRFLKCAAAYPENHPVVTTASHRVTSLLNDLCSTRNEIRLVVSKTSFLTGTHASDPTNPVLARLAASLFQRGIAAITFRAGFGLADLFLLKHILALTPEAVWQQGGGEKIVAQSGTPHLHLENIDYALFSASAEQGTTPPDPDETLLRSKELWDRFIDIILKGSASPASVTHGGNSARVMAAIEMHCSQPEAEHERFAEVASFLAQLDENAEERETMVAPFRARLLSLLSELHPALRSQFLVNVCKLSDLSNPMLSHLLESFPLDRTRELLKGVGGADPVATTLVMKQIQGLCEGGAGSDSRFRDCGTVGGEEGNDGEILGVLLKEDGAAEFVPGKYQHKLERMVEHRGVSGKTSPEIEALRETLTPRSIDESTSLILVELLQTADDLSEGLVESLMASCCDLSRAGDFASVIKISERLSSRCEGASHSRMHDLFAGPEFLNAVLDGVSAWGKSKFREVGALIDFVGAPFAEPLLDRLAEEPGISNRRFYMDRLARMGAVARSAAIARLGDRRWYFVRNLLILLCAMNDESVLPYVRRLKNFPHPKVHQEVLRTLIHFDDDEARQLLLRELSSKDPEQRLAAVKLAEKSRRPEVRQKLFTILHEQKIINYPLLLKLSVVETLAKIGHPDAVPELEKLRQTDSLLHRKKHRRVQEEIARSLSRYPRGGADVPTPQKAAQSAAASHPLFLGGLREDAQ